MRIKYQEPKTKNQKNLILLTFKQPFILKPPQLVNGAGEFTRIDTN